MFVQLPEIDGREGKATMFIAPTVQGPGSQPLRSVKIRVYYLFVDKVFLLGLIEKTAVIFNHSSSEIASIRNCQNQKV